MIKTDLLTGFRDYLRFERRYSDHTCESYSRDVNQFCDFLHLQYTILDLSSVTHHHVRSWMVELLKKKQVATSVRRKISSITHFYKWMRRSGKIDHNPVVKVQLPKIPERLPKSLPANVLERLWEGMKADFEVSGYEAIRDQALIGLLYGCGLRRSEVLNITWKDYDEGRTLLKVIGKGRKERQVPVGNRLKSVLGALKKEVKKEWGDIPHMQIILMGNGKPCYPKFVHNRVVALLGTVTTAEKKSPHILRHSMATHLMDQGAELNAVKALLGHASLAATQVYTHNSISRLKEVYQRAHPEGKTDD